MNKPKKLIIFCIGTLNEKVISLLIFWFSQWKKLLMMEIKQVDFILFYIIKRHETELKWIKLLQTPYPLGFNDNIYHEGNLSKMPDFDVFLSSLCYNFANEQLDHMELRKMEIVNAKVLFKS